MSTVRDWLLQEHSKKQTAFIAQKLIDFPQSIDELITCISGTDKQLQQRASWVLPSLPIQLLSPYYGVLVNTLYTENIHNGVIRNTLKVFEDKTFIPADLEDALTDLCFKYMEESKYPVAIKVFAMTILEKITQRYPELKQELMELIINQMPYASAGFQSRGKKILNKLKKN